MNLNRQKLLLMDSEKLYRLWHLIPQAVDVIPMEVLRQVRDKAILHDKPEILSQVMAYGCDHQPQEDEKRPKSLIEVSPLEETVRYNMYQGVRILHENGATFPQTDLNGSRLLHVAAENQNFKIMLVLLEMGANPLFTNEQGLNPWEAYIEKRANKEGNIGEKEAFDKYLLHHKLSPALMGGSNPTRRL